LTSRLACAIASLLLVDEEQGCGCLHDCILPSRMGAALVCNSPVSLANQLVIDCLRTHLPALHRIGYLSLEVSSDCRKRLHWCKPSGGGLSLEGNLL